MGRISVALRIQHHPSRAHLIPRLLERLSGFDDVAVVADPDPTGRSDTWRTHRACLEAMPAAASHLLVMQDDALPRDGFAEKIAYGIAVHPESVLLAFVPGFSRERVALMKAHAAKERYVLFRVAAFVPTVAIVYPRAVVDGLLAWVDSRVKDRYRRPMQGADDGIVANFFRLTRIHPLALVPCAVEHDETVPSVGKSARTGPHRRAALL